MSEVNAPPAARPRPRSPIRKVTVEAIEVLSPLVRRVVLTGEALEGFAQPRPAAHIKLHMVPHGMSYPEDEASPRPPRRTYTPRSFDASSRRLVVDFLLHGHGMASEWAEGAKPGHSIYVSGPGGGYDVPVGSRSLLLVADDTALPAAGMILENLPPGCRAIVLAEVENAREERELARSGAYEVRWLHRAENSAIAGSLLEAAVANLDAPEGTYWWIASEAASMRRMRKELAGRRGVPMARLHTRGYWKLGEIAYPDHDYGND